MRPSRIEVSEYPYHVYVRGNNKQVLFRDDDDRRKYLGILHKSNEKFGFRLFTYALMDNHIHLMLQMMEHFLLASFMHWIQLGYARHFNERYAQVGHVFQSRYNAQVVDTDNYFLTVDRYIHLNPVRARMVAKPEDFAWSSYRSRMGLQTDSLPLDHDTVLSYFGGSLPLRRNDYREFTEDAMDKPEEWSHDAVCKTRYLGSAEFIRRVQNRTREEKTNSMLR